MADPTFPLRNETDKARAIAIIQQVDPEAGKVWTIKDHDRTEEQNAKLHAMLSDISRQVEHAGKKWNVLIWKRLCTAAWLREIGENATMIPALDGNGFDVIYEKTSKLGVKKCSSLIEWITAFGAENEVRWTQKDVWGGKY